ncbi:hypothetical protein NBO_27g0056 [Nosema bombycis CQ1]|uniref:Uncharacterized protein n=1 Tax=Nosema bombycis (strain CQ1 / CVCC 102059) TaxID=578461 RepID=R0KUI2_NOSB1|nr:hypothetical protein NBO_27g0056 [Nosema bombycis CQ1]|eukprot:EOB14501.1 hypothetical protein NBO_27g0056 [Nosema bombycis CQ1]
MGVSEEVKDNLDLSIEDYVTVGGIKKKFTDITEEDKEKMDEKEYENYFEIYFKYN